MQFLRSILSRLGLCLVCVMAAGVAHAMNVSPMVIEMTSTGTRATGRIQIINVIPQDLPFEVRVYKLDFDNNGEVVETPADADFIVFPPQGNLKHNQRQMVRLQWVGGNLDASRAYYVAVNQLPVALDPAKAAVRDKAAVDVQLVYHMKVLVTVAPPGAKPEVKVAGATPTQIPLRNVDPKASTSIATVPGVTVTVRNSGKRYAMLAAAGWTIEGTAPDGKPLKVTLTAAEMGEILGAGYVAALNGERRFDVPTGVAFGNGPISVKFSQ